MLAVFYLLRARHRPLRKPLFAICGKSVIIVLPRERLRLKMKLPECKVGCPKRGRKKAVELPQTVKQQRKYAIRYPKGMPFKVTELAFINGDWQNVSL